MREPFSIYIAFLFLINVLVVAPAQAEVLSLPKPGTMVHLSTVAHPAVLQGIKVFPNDPLRFDFIVSQGDSVPLTLKSEITTLSKYFLAALTTPENDIWVNLSPYEKDRIVPESFGQTEMGRDLLAQDYILKQLTASLVYPEGDIGKEFWKRIYTQATDKNIPVNTFNKVWIVPNKAVVYENANAGTAYIVESTLKVMTEQDYVATNKNIVGGAGFKPAHIQPAANQVIHDVILPQLTKEINEGKNFTKLRQVYSALILASWYKRKIRESVLSQVYVNKNKVGGITIEDIVEKQRIYERYLEAFKKGVYNYIKETTTPDGIVVATKYFSGGFSGANMDAAMRIQKEPSNFTGLSEFGVVYVREQLMMVRGSRIETARALGGHASTLLVGAANNVRIVEEKDRFIYNIRIKEIFSGFVGAINTMVKLAEESAVKDKIEAFSRFRYLVRVAMQEGADLNKLSAVAQQLTALSEGQFKNDEWLKEVQKQWKAMQQVYFLDEDEFYKDPKKPVMFIVHGTGIGPFPSFNSFIEKYRNKYNIAFLVYDFRNSIEENAKQLNEQWWAFQLRHGINTGGHSQREVIVTFSFGDNVLGLAAMENPTIYTQAALFRVAPVILGSKIVGSIDRLDQKKWLNRFFPSLAAYRQAVSPTGEMQKLLAKGNMDMSKIFLGGVLTVIPEKEPHLDFNNPDVQVIIEALNREASVVILKGATHVAAPSHPNIVKVFERFEGYAWRSAPGTLSNPSMASPGGIDLTPVKLPLDIKDSGSAIKFKLDPAMLRQLNDALGFEPVILRIQPMADVRVFFQE